MFMTLWLGFNVGRINVAHLLIIGKCVRSPANYSTTVEAKCGQQVSGNTSDCKSDIKNR